MLSYITASNGHGIYYNDENDTYEIRSGPLQIVCETLTEAKNKANNEAGDMLYKHDASSIDLRNEKDS